MLTIKLGKRAALRRTSFHSGSTESGTTSPVRAQATVALALSMWGVRSMARELYTAARRGAAGARGALVQTSAGK